MQTDTNLGPPGQEGFHSLPYNVHQKKYNTIPRSIQKIKRTKGKLPKYLNIPITFDLKTNLQKTHEPHQGKRSQKKMSQVIILTPRSYNDDKAHNNFNACRLNARIQPNILFLRFRQRCCNGPATSIPPRSCNRRFENFLRKHSTFFLSMKGTKYKDDPFLDFNSIL